VANIKSQKKRIRQNVRRELRNKGVRSALRTYVKRFQTALESGDLESARLAMQRASKEFDKAASKGVIHRNKAANRKSVLARQLKAE
jgi:small subunit ribosomal protein S20